MNIKILAIFTLLTSTVCHASNNKHVIGTQAGAGLYFNFLGVLNNIRWCKQNNKIPVVYWGPTSLYYEKAGYLSTKNVWEYYFEPVSNAAYQKGDKLWNFNEIGGQKIEPKRLAWCDEYAQQNYRESLHALIKEYIKMKPYLEQKIDDFYKKNMMGKKTIGIHLRGTDKKAEIIPVSIENILNDANKFAQEYPDCQFLIATDEERLLKMAASHLQGKVIYYNANRSQDGSAVHHDKRIRSKAALGEDVIIEANLLSRCDLFLHTCSSVSTAVLFLNPQLKNVFYKGKEKN